MHEHPESMIKYFPPRNSGVLLRALVLQVASFTLAAALLMHNVPNDLLSACSLSLAKKCLIGN